MSSPNNLNAGMRCIKFIIFVISFMFGVSINESNLSQLNTFQAPLSSHLLENGLIERKAFLSFAIIKSYKMLIDN
jgi:hypothetical protein